MKALINFPAAEGKNAELGIDEMMPVVEIHRGKSISIIYSNVRSLVSFVRFAAVSCIALLMISGCGGVDYKPAEVRSEASRGSSDSDQARWWAWALSQPAASSPLSFGQDDSCARGQPTDQWFLAGASDVDSQSSCTVPAGRPLLAPVVIRLAADRAECTRLTRHLELYPAEAPTLDDKALSLNVFEEELVEVEAVADNVLFKQGGVLQGFACGVWVHVPPLAVGWHSLKLSGGLGRGKEGTPSRNFDLSLFAEKRPVRSEKAEPNPATTRR